MSLADKLKNIGISDDTGHEVENPVWDGPQSDSDSGGITFSLLAKYLVDKERFRLRVIEGLAAREGFNHKLEYGNMWHLCEEAYSEDSGPEGLGTALIENRLGDYKQELENKYPFSQEEIDKWFRVCKVQFPIYVKYWETHPDKIKTTPIMQEHCFHVPYKLPSGRVIFLKGKWDRVHLISDLGDDALWLQENKTKGEINVELVEHQLRFDLQTMLYLIALDTRRNTGGIEDIDSIDGDVRGVIYNVVRRPLSGGVGTIKQTQNETVDQFYKRVAGYIDGTGLDGKKNPTPGPKHYFLRWQVGISEADRTKFALQCLDPLLENLCDDYEWWEYCKQHEGLKATVNYLTEDITPFAMNLRQGLFSNHTSRHFRYPYGIYNPLTEDGKTEYDDYLDYGNDAALTKVTNLFPELQS